MNPSDATISNVLRQEKRITVVGLSPRPERPSHSVTAYMIRQGYAVVGVRPGVTEILERPCYPSLLEVPEPIGILNVFRATRFIPDIVEQALQRGVRILWLQEGITHGPAEQRARDAGMQVVSNKCILKEYNRLLR